MRAVACQHPTILHQFNNVLFATQFLWFTSLLMARIITKNEDDAFYLALYIFIMLCECLNSGNTSRLTATKPCPKYLNF